MDDWFFELLATIHTDVKEYEYRLYYKDDGSADHYDMVEVNSPGHDGLRYILVDKEAYDLGCYFVKVVDNALVYENIRKQVKLQPSNKGTRCHPSNIMLIDKTSNHYWELKEYYEN